MNKSKEIIPIIVIAFIAGALSLFISRALFANDKILTTKVEQADPITSNFDYLGKPYFTVGALNPTKDITINENNNPNPVGLTQ